MNRMIEEVAHPNVYANIDVGHAGLVRVSFADMQTIGDKSIHLRSVSLFDPNGIYLEVSAHPQTD